MKPNIIIDGIQLDTYLKDYNISTDLNVIKYKQHYSLDNFIENINTNIFYMDTEITEDDLIFKSNVTAQERSLIIIALNKLRVKVN